MEPCHEIDWKGSRIRVGTSGYSFADWMGNFYPAGLPRSGMLDHYSRFFDTVEINSTYYRILPPATMEGMVRRTPDDFRFFVKLHGSMTHTRDATDGQWARYAEMLAPMRESGKLQGLLAQFPYSFRPERANLEYLAEVADRAGALGDGIDLAVEFRHRRWYEAEARDALATIPAATVSVDLPGLRNLPPRTVLVGNGRKGPGYVRFHGRNAKAWWKGGAERYDWDYDRGELSEWLPGISRLAEMFPAVFLFFNNCHAGQAVRSSRLMMDLLEGRE